MFKTVVDSKINFSYATAPDELLWPYVEKVSSSSWFYCIYAVDDGNVKFKNILFLSNIHQLLNLINHENVEIKDVYLVSADRNRGRSTWCMKQLKKILQATISLSNQKDYFYQYLFKDGSTSSGSTNFSKAKLSSLKFVEVFSL